MATKKIGSFAVAVLGSIPLFWAQVGTTHADDKPFLHYLGGSVYIDDKNVLGVTGEAGYIYDKSFLDFPGGSAYTGDKTFLGFDGHLEGSTGQTIPNAVVTLTGAGLPPQTKADANGNFRASSTSQATQIRVVIKVVGYQPYSVIVFRRENGVSGQNLMPVFRLTPIFPLPTVQSGMRSPSH